MKRLLLFYALVAVLFLALAGFALAGGPWKVTVPGVCKGGYCTPAVTYEWKTAPLADGGEAGHLWLYRDGVHVGGHNGVDYHPWDGAKWLGKMTPPVEPPPPKLAAKGCDCPCSKGGECTCRPGECPDGKAPAVGDNFGVDEAKIRDAPAYSVSGIASTAAGVKSEIAGGGTLTDDSGKPWVVIRTDDAKIKTALLDGLAPLKDECRIAVYPPGHWALTTVGMDHGLVYCQAPDGKVTHHQDDFAGGAPAAVAAVRRANKDFDKAKVPDQRNVGPSLPNLPSLDGVKAFLLGPDPWIGIPVWVYGAIALVLYIRSRK